MSRSVRRTALGLLGADRRASRLAGPAESCCPCGSGRTLVTCCLPCLDGEAAPTAEALMRSRYTAFALGDEDYLFRTWHPRTRPSGPYGDPATTWTGLTIEETAGGDEDEPDGAEAVVAFTARYRLAGADGVLGPEQVMRERSRFLRRAGRWLYVEAL